jgi:translation initiation factor 6 (eIF-6)
MGEQMRKTWDKSAVPVYIALAVVLSMGCGYSISASQNRQAMVDLSEVHSKERASIRRAAKAEVKALTDRNTFLTNQITILAGKSGDAAKAALEQKVDK